MRLSSQDRATLLAALYAYRSEGYGDTLVRPAPVQTLATDDGKLAGLDDEGVKNLYLRIQLEAT